MTNLYCQWITTKDGSCVHKLTEHGVDAYLNGILSTNHGKKRFETEGDLFINEVLQFARDMIVKHVSADDVRRIEQRPMEYAQKNSTLITPSTMKIRNTGKIDIDITNERTSKHIMAHIIPSKGRWRNSSMFIPLVEQNAPDDLLE